MELTIIATEQDLAQMGATEQDFHEIVAAYWDDEGDLLAWLTESAQVTMEHFIHDTEPFTFEPPKHEGRVILTVKVPLEESFKELADCEIGELLQEAALGAYRSGEVLWRVEWLFWDIIESGM